MGQIQTCVIKFKFTRILYSCRQVANSRSKFGLNKDSIELSSSLVSTFTSTVPSTHRNLPGTSCLYFIGHQYWRVSTVTAQALSNLRPENTASSLTTPVLHYDQSQLVLFLNLEPQGFCFVFVLVLVQLACCCRWQTSTGVPWPHNEFTCGEG